MESRMFQPSPVSSSSSSSTITGELHLGTLLIQPATPYILQPRAPSLHPTPPPTVYVCSSPVHYPIVRWLTYGVVDDTLNSHLPDQRSASRIPPSTSIHLRPPLSTPIHLAAANSQLPLQPRHHRHCFPLLPPLPSHPCHPAHDRSSHPS